MGSLSLNHNMENPRYHRKIRGLVCKQILHFNYRKKVLQGLGFHTLSISSYGIFL